MPLFVGYLLKFLLQKMNLYLVARVLIASINVLRIVTSVTFQILNYYHEKLYP